jgi:hypothetical protein
MAKHRYKVLEEAITRQAAFAEGLEAGAEIEHDFGHDTEKAVIAAGWVERLDTEDAPKGGKK